MYKGCDVMGKKYFMGIDIGTYESKGVLIDENTNVVASHACPHLMETIKPGYAEHDAEKTWWADFCELSNTLIAKAEVDPKDIAAVGCSTIAPCCLPVDKDLNPLRKAILYGIDVRAEKEINYLNELYGEDTIFEKYGTPITTQSAAAKILWIKNNEPEIYAKTDKFVTGTTYLVAKLCGEYVIDNYTAATWVPMYNMENCDWEEELDIFCRRDQLADCKWSDELVGEVHKKAAKETGLLEGTKVITGTADASAEAVSVGVLDPGDMMIMYGSSIFIIHVVERFTKDKRLWAGPYLFPNTYSVAAGMSTAGTITRWFRDNLARDILALEKEKNINVYDELIKSVEGIEPGSDGLIVLPYFSGERTPIHDPKAKGLIFGLNLLHTREHIYNACLEGVGYGIGQHFDIFQEMGVDTKKVMAVGGGTKSRKWLEIISDISGKRQNTVKIQNGAAYGDALLAALGIGFFKDREELAKAIEIKDHIDPDLVKTEAYKPYKENYKDLYKATKHIMHKL